MSMITHIIAFRPPDERWKKMKAIWDSCVDAGIDLPREVSVFFGGKEPSPEGVQVEIKEAVEAWNDGDMCEGFQVDIEKLPKDIKYLRFYNDY